MSETYEVLQDVDRANPAVDPDAARDGADDIGRHWPGARRRNGLAPRSERNIQECPDPEEQRPMQVFFQPLSERELFSKQVASELQADKTGHDEIEVVVLAAQHPTERKTFRSAAAIEKGWAPKAEPSCPRAVRVTELLLQRAFGLLHQAPVPKEEHGARHDREPCHAGQQRKAEE